MTETALDVLERAMALAGVDPAHAAAQADAIPSDAEAAFQEAAARTTRMACSDCGVTVTADDTNAMREIIGWAVPPHGAVIDVAPTGHVLCGSCSRRRQALGSQLALDDRETQP